LQRYRSFRSWLLIPDIFASDILSVALCPAFASLQREWGKPVNKIHNAKDNPFQIPLYKLAGKDGKGAWFARRSVHEGLGFIRWRSKLKTEFEETLRIRRENEGAGRSGGGAIRGVGAEKRLEKIPVPEMPQDGSCTGEMGLVEVYQLSRDFQDQRPHGTLSYC
jgi:hypothetical protein